MWWMTTTPPRVSSPAGRARYASISSPSCPVILIVSALSESLMRAILSRARAATPRRCQAPLREGQRHPDQAAADAELAPRPRDLGRVPPHAQAAVHDERFGLQLVLTVHGGHGGVDLDLDPGP